MEYTWKHGIQIGLGSNLQDRGPLEVAKILVDLCTGRQVQDSFCCEAQRQSEASSSANVASRKVHRREDRSTTQRRWLHSYGRVQTFHGRLLGADCVLKLLKYPLSFNPGAESRSCRCRYQLTCWGF